MRLNKNILLHVIAKIKKNTDANKELKKKNPK